MTHNQINFQAHLENVRHNVRSEQLTERGQDLSLKATAMSAAATRYSADRHYAATVYSSDRAFEATKYSSDVVAQWQSEKTTQSYVDSAIGAASWAIPFAFGYGASRKKQRNDNGHGGSQKPSGASQPKANPVEAPQRRIGFDTSHLSSYSTAAAFTPGQQIWAQLSGDVSAALDSSAPYFRGIEQALSSSADHARTATQFGAGALGGFASMMRFIPLF